MFWRFGAYNSISTLDTILDKPDTTVEELLDESDLIQELKQNNSKLIEFLREDHVLERLLQYVVAPKLADVEPSPDEPDEEEHIGGGGALGFFGSRKRRSRSKSITKVDGDEESKEERQGLKYAYVSCEVLSCDVWSISEAMLENQQSLRKFWEYIKQENPLDAVQAGYFTKVNDSLLDKKTEEMLNFFKTIENVIPDMVQHVDCPVIMDLLLKMISLERSEGGQGIVDWLQSQNLISLLLARLSSDYPPATQTAAGDFLKAIITISANATAQDTNVIGPNELTRQLVSKDCVQNLIREMLRGGNPLTVGVGIVIEVIRKNNSDYDLDNQIGPVPKSSDPIYLGTLLRQFAENIPNFMDLIQKPSEPGNKRELRVAFGEKIEPLGFDRFKTCELMAELLHCSNMALLNEKGAEAEVHRRNVERERLKAEGRLTPGKEVPAEAEFGTSVDSSGFHHARAPSFDSDAPDEIKRSEAPNGADDEFENVNASEVSDDEMKHEFDEKELAESTENPSAKTGDVAKRQSQEYPDPKSPRKESAPKSPIKPDSRFTTEQADSPTSAGVTEKLESVDLHSDDTVMRDSPNHETIQQEEEPLKTSDAGQSKGLSPHPEDTPAPLFASKHGSEQTCIPTSEHETCNHNQLETDESYATGAQEPNDDSTLDEDMLGPYVIDIDGRPVVGDLLKMMFVGHQVVPTILDFFFRFPWNNFLHNVVYDVVQQVFNGQMTRGYNRSLAIDLFETGRITERIVEGQQASDKAEKESNMRLGYMGHLTLIAEEVVKFTERHPPELLSQSVLDKVMALQWIDYVEQTLAETRERDNAILGGVRPDMSIGPRQAVLNAVNAAQGGFGGSGLSSGFTGNGSLSLDSVDLSNVGGATSSSTSGYLFSGSSLLSGFNHGSSDEEDEEMDELGESGMTGMAHQLKNSSQFDEEDQVGELSIEDVEMDYR